MIGSCAAIRVGLLTRHLSVADLRESVVLRYAQYCNVVRERLLISQ